MAPMGLAMIAVPVAICCRAPPKTCVIKRSHIVFVVVRFSFFPNVYCLDFCPITDGTKTVIYNLPSKRRVQADEKA